MRYSVIVRDNDESNKIANEIKKRIIGEEVKDNPEIVIAIGGDGTIIKATHIYPNAIIFGVHTGHLGFFANYSRDNIDLLIKDINNNEYKVDKLDSLQAKFKNKNEDSIIDFAINEFSILSPQRTLNIDVYIDDEYFERFRGTGFAVSTPYGSTAYNKSLGGGVVDTSLSIIQWTEIAGINSNSYKTLSSPLVLSSDRIIKLEAKSENADVVITADNKAYMLSDFDYIEIKSMKNSIKMAYHKHESFLKRINRTFIISKE